MTLGKQYDALVAFTDCEKARNCSEYLDLKITEGKRQDSNPAGLPAPELLALFVWIDKAVLGQ